jgi:hypothetical protein
MHDVLHPTDLALARQHRQTVLGLTQDKLQSDLDSLIKISEAKARADIILCSKVVPRSNPSIPNNFYKQLTSLKGHP